MPADPSAFASVDLKGTPGNFLGDVDVLLCPRSQPELATAISVKRIKFGASAIRNGQPNKLRELKKATEQANRLADLGFHLVYSFVFVAIDTREQNAGKKDSFAGLPVELSQFVHSAVTVQELNPRIGLYRTEYVQPMDDDPLSTGSFYGFLVRNAQPVQQGDNLTEWVSQVMLRETAIERWCKCSDDSAPKQIALRAGSGPALGHPWPLRPEGTSAPQSGAAACLRLCRRHPSPRRQVFR